MLNFLNGSGSSTDNTLNDEQEEVVDRVKKSLKTIKTHWTNQKTLRKIDETFTPDQMNNNEIIKAYINASNSKGDVSEKNFEKYYGNVNKALNGSSDEDNNPYYESIEEYPEWVENSEKFFTKVAIWMEKVENFFNFFKPKSPKIKRVVSDTEDTVQKTMEAEPKRKTESYAKSANGGYIKLAK